MEELTGRVAFITGGASGIALLIRTAAGDMYPPERRARGISYVLFGAVFGAILGPVVFGPLFAGADLRQVPMRHLADPRVQGDFTGDFFDSLTTAYDVGWPKPRVLVI